MLSGNTKIPPDGIGTKIPPDGIGKKTLFHTNFIQNYHQQAQCDVLYNGVLN